MKGPPKADWGLLFKCLGLDQSLRRRVKHAWSWQHSSRTGQGPSAEGRTAGRASRPHAWGSCSCLNLRDPGP